VSHPLFSADAVAGSANLPYRIACLCDLRDAQGRILLLHRKKEPNLNLVSPIGGKLDVALGESPAQCAQREILEEAGLHVDIDDLQLVGIVSEQAFEGKGHWLMFVYRVLPPVVVEPRDMREGRLDWFEPSQLDTLPVPETDRKVIWPLLIRAYQPLAHNQRPGFFTVHIDCRNGMRWSVEQES
jgi:8-oxo-dGTP diphosphatase